ncbi:MAG: DUF4215 domain-containing protein [Nannocystaceae bacterium]
MTAICLCIGLAPATAHAGGPIPLWPDTQAAEEVPGAADLSLYYNLYNRDTGETVRRMDTNDLQYYANRARCECDERIEMELRLLPSYVGDQGDQLDTFVGVSCETSELNTTSNFTPCAVLNSGVTSSYLNGVVRDFGLIWLTNGVLDRGSLDRDPDTAAPGGSCTVGESTGGVYMCAPNANGTPACQADDFFILGDKIDNITDDTMMTGLSYDFQNPRTFPTSFETSIGDGAVEIAWELDMPGDIQGYRVLCADENGNPAVDSMVADPESRRFSVNISADTNYYTRENLCGEAQTVCGDGQIDPGEQCDGSEDCNDDCTLIEETCGNGQLDPDETCDDGNDVNEDTCLNTCEPASCGDGYVGPAEQCDSMLPDPMCSATCSLSPTCGDGTVDADEGEECDDGNDIETDACLSSCKTAICGDGIVADNEDCDSSLGCTDTCEIDTCANGELDDGEEDVDCGGTCPNTCESCSDGAQNGDETGIDCGGSCPDACDDPCTNGTQDGDEEGIDCGGSCADSCDGIRSLDWSYVCSDALTANANGARIDGLENDRPYNFLVVAYDKAGNPRVSQMLTATPKPTSDFWEQCEADGNICGDGGFCSLVPRKRNDGQLAMLAIGLAALGLRRRRWRSA